MLPDVGGTELVLIAAVALIVVGPKDLPALMRKVGQFVGKMRAMANEFRASFDDMARQSELDDLRKEIDAMKAERIDPAGWTADTFKGDAVLDWEDPDADLYVPPETIAAIEASEAAAAKPKRTRKPRAKTETTPAPARPRRTKAAAAEGAASPPKRTRKPKAAT
jgi:sec-independent protein translocase protein TatB